jgi:hypothetical protein
MTRVGALRPLKFARHLPAFGWAPVVLCDLWRDDPVDSSLLEAVPSSTVVVRDWARTSAGNMRALEARGSGPFPEPNVAGRPTARRRRGWRPSPEWLPLGVHMFDIPHARRAARDVLRRYPDCRAIVVNADPYAAMIVGAELARTTGLPLVQDLRDPWAVCELRRPERPAAQRLLVDRLERWAFERAAKVVLNTETTLADVRAHYPDLPPERFTCIRNHADPELIAGGTHPGFDRFTALFLGNLRRHVEGDVLLRALERLRR